MTDHLLAAVLAATLIGGAMSGAAELINSEIDRVVVVQPGQSERLGRERAPPTAVHVNDRVESRLPREEPAIEKWAQERQPSLADLMAARARTGPPGPVRAGLQKNLCA